MHAAQATDQLGLIAGNRSLPLEFARLARQGGLRRIVAVAFEGETDPALAGLVDEIVWLRVGQLGRMISAFTDRGLRQCVMLGQIAPRNLFDLRPDLRAMRLLFRLKEKNAHSLFGAIADELRKDGVELIEATPWLKPIMPGAGFALGAPLGKEHRADLDYAFRLAKEVSRLDIGQTIVVKDGAVLAVEGFEGTDQCLARGGQLAGRKGGAVAVKVAKADHDLRFDIPTVGLTTVETCAANGVAVLAVEAGRTLLLEREAVTDFLGRHRLAFTTVMRNTCLLAVMLPLLALLVPTASRAAERVGVLAATTPAPAPDRKSFPAHWGSPPAIQTMDYRPLPGGYGFGSSTLARWIEGNLRKDQAARPRQGDGNGQVEVSGELRQWHKVMLTLDGPFAHERDTDPNPFTDYRLTVVFTHESGSPRHVVPGYFAADGDAGDTSAESGTRWRGHLSPDKPGRWDYALSLRKGPQAATDDDAARNAVSVVEKAGSFEVSPTDKTGRDFRAEGRLQYVGRHHLRFEGSGRYFLKAGADAPESLLAYADFDGTRELRPPGAPRRAGEASPKGLHRYEPHVADWRPGDPTWQGGKGKGLIGALNYLAGKGGNAFSFLPYNVGGDGENVWPFVEPTDKLHYDCSKLDQWGIVFEHATARGLYLHFKLQENELDDNRMGHDGQVGEVAAALDGGRLGPERKLYCRELIARFAHNLALNWNLGEENTQSPEEIRDMARYLHDTDPYRHHIVIHTFPDQQDKVYPPLLGEGSALTGASLQNSWSAAHQRTLKWVAESAKAGKPWVVANDEQNPAEMGVPPDPGYEGHDGVARQDGKPYTLHDIRKATLWGNLMAGGAGVEYYFGYQLPQNDLGCEDWRSRDRSWDYCRIALGFFRDENIPFWEMASADALVGNARNDNSRYCLAKSGELYLVYLPEGGTSELDLGGGTGPFTIRWFNPRDGGTLQRGSVRRVASPGKVALGEPPSDPDQDWLVVVRRRSAP